MLTPPLRPPPSAGRETVCFAEGRGLRLNAGAALLTNAPLRDTDEKKKGSGSFRRRLGRVQSENLHISYLIIFKSCQSSVLEVGPALEFSV